GALGIGGVPGAAAGAEPGYPGVAAGFAAPAMAGPVGTAFGSLWAGEFARRRVVLIAAVAVIVVMGLIGVLINNSISNSISHLPGFGSLNSSLSTTCTVGRDSQGAPGWVVKFTNATSSDVPVSGFTVLFFNSSGAQT